MAFEQASHGFIEGRYLPEVIAVLVIPQGNGQTHRFHEFPALVFPRQA